jgi:hypothetical protein
MGRRETILVDGADRFATEPAAMSRALGLLADRIANALRVGTHVASGTVGPPSNRNRGLMQTRIEAER